jgi:hypothetical protein
VSYLGQEVNPPGKNAYRRKDTEFLELQTHTHGRVSRKSSSRTYKEGTASILAANFPFMDTVTKICYRSLHIFWILLRAFNRIFSLKTFLLKKSGQ